MSEIQGSVNERFTAFINHDQVDESFVTLKTHFRKKNSLLLL